jgi:DNA polymerase-1
METSKNLILLLDGSSLIYRAFYAMPRFTSSQGKPTGAVLGFGNMLLRLIEDFNPFSLITTFDHPQKTFRHQLTEEYKAQRKPMPDELIPQVQLVKDLIDSFSLKWIEVPGFEGDDIIGSLRHQIPEKFTTAMVSSDLDLLQLVNEKTILLQPVKGVTQLKIIDKNTLIDQYGLTPQQIIDFIALTGDPSDNIPGLPGIGEKTALDLLKRYHNWQGILRHHDELPVRIQKAIQEFIEQVELSLQLVTIIDTIPLDINFQSWNFQQVQWKSLFTLLDELGLVRFKERLMKKRNEIYQKTLPFFSNNPKKRGEEL